MPTLTLKTIKRVGTWLTAVCAVAYTAFSLLDIGLHLHEGWMDGVRHRDDILNGKAECGQHRFMSSALQTHCARIHATPVPAPWRIALHHMGHHLRDKITSALNSILLLAAMLLPVAAAVFYCTYRYHQHSAAINRQPPISIQDFFAACIPLTASPPHSYAINVGHTTDGGERRPSTGCVLIDTASHSALSASSPPPKLEDQHGGGYVRDSPHYRGGSGQESNKNRPDRPKKFQYPCCAPFFYLLRLSLSLSLMMMMMMRCASNDDGENRAGKK
jgi:hypothetical protein